MSTTSRSPGQLPDNSSADVEREVELVIRPDGRVEFLHDDDLAALVGSFMPLQTRRAGHVEPTTDGRWAVDLSPLAGEPADLTTAIFGRRDLAVAYEAEQVRRTLRGDQ